MNITSNQLVSLFDRTTNDIKSQAYLSDRVHLAVTQFADIISVVVFSFVRHDLSRCGTRMKRPVFPPDVGQTQRKLMMLQFLCSKAVTFTTNLKLNGKRLVTQSAVFRASRMGHDNHLMGGTSP